MILINIALAMLSYQTPDSSTVNLLVGSYTRQGNPGIEIIDPQTRKMVHAVAQSQASFQALSKDQQYLFSVHEEIDGKGAISSYKQEKGTFSRLSTQLTQGDAPCYVLFRDASQTVYVANYMGGNLSVFQSQGGILQPISQNIIYPKPSKAHMAVIMPDGGQLVVTDLAADKIHVHALLANGLVATQYEDVELPKGTGPRHMVFNKSGDIAYVLGELSGTVDVFRIYANEFTHLQRIVIDQSVGNPNHASADLHLSPDGKWLLASNRKTQNSIRVLAVLPSGELRDHKEYVVGKMPRNFQFDPSGRFVYVACQGENRIQKFAFTNGELTDNQEDIEVKQPVALLFLKK
ncbi:lactonase family protein [Aquirufa sp.]|jgi:6-phosphogluconolactonase|uniref:lactonase family protein n=1 Tax=Aquirufa sp. TaxID=2676249 RepID=UPI0037BF0280